MVRLVSQITEDFDEATVQSRGFGILDVGYRSQVIEIEKWKVPDYLDLEQLILFTAKQQIFQVCWFRPYNFCN